MTQIDPESREYQDARERLYEHVREHHSEPLTYMAAVKGAQTEFAESIRKGYETNLEKAHTEGFGVYANHDYAAGALQGVRDWERQITEGERVRHAERERQFYEKAW
ncbi:MAG: hypothetical protein ACJ73N_05665 [Bryobacteraceae bacterium]